MVKNKVIILGAGPAGLSAGLELAKKGYNPVIIDKDSQVGGMSKTLEYKGHRFDLGPHRFFTKSDEINKLWNDTLGDDFIEVERLTRIYYKQKFFFYPVKLFDVIKTIGFFQSSLIGLSYFKQKLFPYKNEETFEKWVINRFGSRLYSMFFKNYTYKLWGIDPKEISAEWAAQRIKGLSISSALKAALFSNKGNVKTLIDKFNYPKYGAGHMYEEKAKRIVEMGGQIKLNEEVQKIIVTKDNTYKVISDKEEYTTDKMISSIPFTQLFTLLDPKAPEKIIESTKALKYRSIVEVNLILKDHIDFKDNWIYLHDPNVSALRLVNYKNWGKWMNPAKDSTPIGLEYFCDEDDEIWNKNDQHLIDLAIDDIETLDFSNKEKLIDAFVVRNPKAYPVYFGEYQKHLDALKKYFTENLPNAQVIGRYGMYKYNNMDHSIMTGLCAAKNIHKDKDIYDIWEVNVDQDYHEEKKS